MVTRHHCEGFPCFDDLLFQACRRHYPDGTTGCCRCLAQRHRPSPKARWVGFRHIPFRGLLGVHSRFGLPVRSITQGDFYQSTSTHVVTSLRRSGCFRPSDRLAGWDSHPLEIADFHGVLSFRGAVAVTKSYRIDDFRDARGSVRRDRRSRQDARQANSFSSSARNGNTLTWKC